MGTSLGIGSHYFVTFIDDSTRKLCVYFLKRKSNVFETFKKWRVVVENEIGCKLKCLSKEFKNYCAKNGIRREK